jgi:rhodanese-related sulfurtransferase/DNA-binding winged helix-turn-helix (wHTH) protein
MGCASTSVRREVSRGREPIHLTPIEYKLLVLFAQHAGKVLTHRHILKEVWGPAYATQTHYVRVHMAELRKKVEVDPTRPRLLVTEPGVGYRLRDRGAMEAVQGAELLRRVRGGEVTVLDVRPREEYRAGHFPGALCIPVEELKSRLKELPKDREVVAYCRGPYCVMAVDAVALLRKKGFQAHRLEYGVADFRARGLRVEVGEGRPS